MTSYVNNYKAPSADIPRDCHLHTPPEEYDHNYIFEVKPLQSDRVEMRPFIVSHDHGGGHTRAEPDSLPCTLSCCLTA